MNQKRWMILVSLVILLTVSMVSAQDEPCPDCYENDFGDGGHFGPDEYGDEYGDHVSPAGDDPSTTPEVVEIEEEKIEECGEVLYADAGWRACGCRSPASTAGRTVQAGWPRTRRRLSGCRGRRVRECCRPTWRTRRCLVSRARRTGDRTP